VREVRLIGLEGEQLGILPVVEAYKKAQEVGYDLVEVSPNSVPPVCKIMDFGKYKYELNKKEHQSRRHQKSTQVKEIKLRPRTDKHDLEIKIRQIKGFLAEGNKTKVTLTFRGREMANQELGRSVMNVVIEQLADSGVIEYAPRMEGRSLIMVVAPKGAAGSAASHHPTPPAAGA
jgi:translation initiation factor IF-3